MFNVALFYIDMFNVALFYIEMLNVPLFYFVMFNTATFCTQLPDTSTVTENTKHLHSVVSISYRNIKDIHLYGRKVLGILCCFFTAEKPAALLPLDSNDTPGIL